MTNTATEEIKRLAEIIWKTYDNFAKDYILFGLPDAIRTAIAKAILEAGYLPSSSVVGTLQWEELSNGVLVAKTPIGTYKILPESGKASLIGEWTRRDISNIEDGKERAQSHYSAIIGSCLVGVVIPTGEELERASDEALTEIHKHTTLCATEGEEHIFLNGFNAGMHYIAKGSCLQGGGYMEEQMKDLIQYMYKRITKTTLAPFNIEDYFNDYLSSLKQQ